LFDHNEPSFQPGDGAADPGGREAERVGAARMELPVSATVTSVPMPVSSRPSKLMNDFQS
jgi:hypothetical protein